AYKWAKANKKRREYQNAKGKSKKSKPCGAKLRSRMGYFSSLLGVTTNVHRRQLGVSAVSNLARSKRLKTNIPRTKILGANLLNGY
ncbi:hypothetical protein B9Z45_15680, partial [Limnohabitans sp. 2KL-17]